MNSGSGSGFGSGVLWELRFRALGVRVFMGLGFRGSPGSSTVAGEHP